MLNVYNNVVPYMYTERKTNAKHGTSIRTRALSPYREKWGSSIKI